MFRYSSQSDNDIFIATQNLNALNVRQATLFESKKALLSELAYSIRQGKNIGDDIRESYLSAFPRSLKQNPYFNALSTVEKIEICRDISSAMDLKSAFYESLLGESEDCELRAKGRVAYVKNNFTDSAYLFFSKAIPSSRCAYFDSFDTVCEDVHSGTSEFCILPVETSTDGKLISFYSLIDKYELKILSIRTVEHQGSSNFTKFALLGRSLYFPDNMRKKGLKFELRISQPTSEASAICHILSAAEACKTTLCRINSLPLPYIDSIMSYYAVFDLKDADLRTFLTYLTLEHPQCYALGIYFEN